VGAIIGAQPHRTRIVPIGFGWSRPAAVTLDAKGNVYVADPSAGEVKEVSPPFTGATHGKVRRIGSGFTQPWGIAVDGKGNIYVSDTDRIVQIARNGLLSTVAAGLSYPTGIAVDARGIVYEVGEGLSSAQPAWMVLRIEPKRGGGWKAPTSFGSGFVGPSSVAVDVAGSVYVADAANPGSTVKEVEPSGRIVTIGSGYKTAQGVAVLASCKSKCLVYVADSVANVVDRVSPSGTMTQIGYGFSGPGGVAVDVAGDVFVADTGTGQVKEVLP
jgi:sugar lactone lactonase YvrE